MSVWKSFVLYNNATGAPVPGKSLRLVDLDGLLPDVEMTASGAGVYRAQVDEGIWKVMDVTGLPTIVDTGYRLDALSSLVREPAIAAPSASPSGKFWDGTKTFRVVEIADVDGLQAALDAEESAREGADTEEALARANADAALDARVDVLEARALSSLWTQPGGSTTGAPLVGDGIAAFAQCTFGFAILEKSYAGIGYRLVGYVTLPAIGSMTPSAPVRVKLPAASITLPAFGPYAPYCGVWTSFTLPGGGYQNETGGIEVISATATEIILEMSGMLWSETFAGRVVRFSADIVGA